MNLHAFYRISQFLIFSLILTLSACSSAGKLKQGKLKAYQQLIEESPVFGRAFTGFQLYDPASQTILYSKNADHYFTPASNTKILTLYTSLQMLGDSIPALHYVETGDSLIFWGTGNPALANPFLPEDNQVFDFLKKQNKQLFFTSGNFQDTRFGAGWSWDDYYYAFQAEKAALPVHGNIVKVTKAQKDIHFRVEPGYFSDSFSKNENVNGSSLKRVSDYNIFEYNSAMQRRSYARNHPFIYSDQLAVNLLIDKVQKNIRVLSPSLPLPENHRSVYIGNVDSIYTQLMQESDNFIAEQMMLLCSDHYFKTLNTDQIIEYASDSLFYDLPDQPLWADGSGLSRYNLFTPRSIVFILNKLHQQIPEDRLFSIFPAGGVSGTIKNWYGNPEGPYIFAKTGTLSNVHCLSGYIKTDSGKTLIFSFMHNNFKGSSKAFKEEMQRVLEEIKRSM